MKYRFAQFEIDSSRHELLRGGVSVHIEPQVFDVIVHLIRNRNRIVSKDDLIETIWNGRAISEAALSSRINGARRALGDNGNDQKVIKTVHKRGFRFVADAREIDANSDEVVASLVPEGVVLRSAPEKLSLTAELSALGDVVSESIRAEVVTRSSVAVMPFGNMSGNPENDYFSYGLTEDIIRLLQSLAYRYFPTLNHRVSGTPS